MYLRSFIDVSQKNADLNTYFDIIKSKEEQIRKCYAEDFDMSSDEFVRMILTDATFVIEILMNQKIVMPFTRLEVDHDLVLAENQLPFFILEDLYSAAIKPNDHSFMDIACRWLDVDLSRVQVDPSTNEAKECCHLLDLLRSHRLPSPSKKIMNININDERQQCITNIKVRCGHLLDLLRGLCLPSHQKNSTANNRSMLCPTAMSLYEAGVMFRVTEEPCSLLDIHFNKDKGILTIPNLLVEDPTECLFRNMLAFEQCHYSREVTYIADYNCLMDCLINTRQDVQLLAKAGIIHNWLGSDKEVSCLINSLGTNIITDPGNYNYHARITRDLNNYCNKRWNRHRATLMHTYFKHPWAVLSVIYAVILLLLTIAQLLIGILDVLGVKK